MLTRAVIALACFGLLPAIQAAEPLVIHEWGTFTALQDEAGQELPGINVDDEPVPEFVHNLQPYLLDYPFLSSVHWRYRQKGAPRQHPRVTMRLETPVIYFHPPRGADLPLTVDVDVRFRGGWLTEFYPAAQPDAPGLNDGDFRFGGLTPETEGRLRWPQLQVGAAGSIPETDWPVWLAPRQVEAAPVISQEGESERYLFYRGVGCGGAPLTVTTDRAAQQLSVHSNFAGVLADGQSAAVQQLWLVNVLPDGTMAYRSVQGFIASADPSPALAQVSYAFPDDAYSVDSLSQLKSEMHGALTADGLYADEATALLKTWSWAYFRSPGLRLFFLVPRVWTDQRLPLEASASLPTRIERVMVGRIELKSDRQALLLDQLAATAVSDDAWITAIPESPARERFLAGRIDFGELGVAIPEDYQLYLSLGRFRTALVAAEERRRPGSSLTPFMDEYALQPFRVLPPKTNPPRRTGRRD